jgi:tetratricopeptide (TPR) repeat protein
MRQFIFNLLFVTALLVAACSGPKVATVPVVSGKNLAEKAEAEGNFVQAVEAWKQYFTQTPLEKTEGTDFARAAQMAYKAGDVVQSVSWFDQARYKNYADAEVYQTLALIYRDQKNISKELTALEYVAANYPEKKPETSQRLFQIYNEIKEPLKAIAAFENMGETQKAELPNLTTLFDVKKELNDTLACDALSLKILEKQPVNQPALEWNATKYYWKGETRYQREMNKYNSNKTNKQYKILLDQLELSTADFKKSLVYLEQLWKQEQGKKYASYFANIYARFGDEAKAKSYEKYLK